MEIYAIMSMNEAGETHTMRDAYTTQAGAMEALGVYRQEAEKRGDRELYYYVVLNVVK